MREIIFRGKRTSTKEWVEGDLQQDRDLEQFYIYGYDYYTDGGGLEREEFCFEVLPDTVGQYAGLTDKNGKKIFEGDRLTVPDDEIDEAVVEFGSGSFRISLYGNRGATMEYGWDETAGGYGIVESEPIEFYGVNEVEVIGNIFDNSDLLKEGAN